MNNPQKKSNNKVCAFASLVVGPYLLNLRFLVRKVRGREDGGEVIPFILATTHTNLIALPCSFYYFYLYPKLPSCMNNRNRSAKLSAGAMTRMSNKLVYHFLPFNEPPAQGSIAEGQPSQGFSHPRTAYMGGAAANSKHSKPGQI